MRCEKCGKPATRFVDDKVEINGGHVEGLEHLPPMIHHQRKRVGVCEEHKRDAVVIPNEELRKLRETWSGQMPTGA